MRKDYKSSLLAGIKGKHFGNLLRLANANPLSSCRLTRKGSSVSIATRSRDPILTLIPLKKRKKNKPLHYTTQMNNLILSHEPFIHFNHLIFPPLEGLEIILQIPFEFVILNHFHFSFSQVQIACSYPHGLDWTFSWNWVGLWQLQQNMTEEIRYITLHAHEHVQGKKTKWYLNVHQTCKLQHMSTKPHRYPPCFTCIKRNEKPHIYQEF